jgi:uncharacterized membrane protein YwzB
MLKLFNKNKKGINKEIIMIILAIAITVTVALVIISYLKSIGLL